MTELMLVGVYKDTCDLFTEDEILDDNTVDLWFPKELVKRYFMEKCLEDFRGDDGTISDEGLYQEWLDEYTCDDTDGLVQFARENGFEVKREK